MGPALLPAGDGHLYARLRRRVSGNDADPRRRARRRPGDRGACLDLADGRPAGNDRRLQRHVSRRPWRRVPRRRRGGGPGPLPVGRTRVTYNALLRLTATVYRPFNNVVDRYNNPIPGSFDVATYRCHIEPKDSAERTED